MGVAYIPPLANLKNKQNMPTVNQFVRAYGASVRRSERSQQRRAREAAKNYKLQTKTIEIANATQAVQQYQEYIDVLLSTHKNCTQPVDWNSIINEPKPVKNQIVIRRQVVSKKDIENFKPSFLDRIFGGTNKKI